MVGLGQEGFAWGWGELSKIPYKGVEQNRWEFKCCNYWENWKTICKQNHTGQGEFPDKVTQDVNCFTDEPVVQYDVRVVKNAFVDDSK